MLYEATGQPRMYYTVPSIRNQRPSEESGFILPVYTAIYYILLLFYCCAEVRRYLFLMIHFYVNRADDSLNIT